MADVIRSDLAEVEQVVDAGRLRQHVEALASTPRSRRWFSAGMEAAERYATQQLTESGWTVTRQPFRKRLHVGPKDCPNRYWPVTAYRNLRGCNLLARREGEHGGPVLVVGAHLDTVRGSPGADDNASGVAVVLELARALAMLPKPGPPVVLALFDMEEVGQVGSAAAARYLATTSEMSGMICLESVGFFNFEPRTQRIPPGLGLLSRSAVRHVRAADSRGDFILAVHRRSSRHLVRQWQVAATQGSRPIATVLLADPRPDGALGVAAGYALPPLSNLSRSDHAPFWNRRVPSVMLTGTANFRNERYHGEGDLPDTLDYDALAAVTAATGRTVLSVTAASARGMVVKSF